MTQRKIERWHLTLKNRILLENYYLPGELEARIEAFVAHYNHLRYHESIDNLTPADVYFGRGQTILLERERIKRKTIQHRRCITKLMQPKIQPDAPDSPLYQIALSATHGRRCRGFVRPIQALDSTRICDAIIRASTLGSMSQDFRVWVLDQDASCLKISDDGQVGKKVFATLRPLHSPSVIEDDDLGPETVTVPNLSALWLIKAGNSFKLSIMLDESKRDAQNLPRDPTRAGECPDR